MSAPPPGWPHRAASHRIRCAPHDWHVQLFGQGPDLLLLHGAGASGHTWRHLVPLLSGFRLIVPDLPGQGFTRAGGRGRFGLEAMADDLAHLMHAEGWAPAAIIGHSAGAAIALRMSEILPVTPAALVGVNAALGPFEGFAGWLFPKLARAMAMSPIIAHAVAKMSAQRPRIERLIESTGSRLDAEGIELYRTLVARPAHVEATLGMMADWRLEPLLARLHQVRPPVLLIASRGDRAVPPSVSRVAAARLPDVEYAEIATHGHLVHEEAPAAVAALLLPFLARHLGPPRQSAAAGRA